MKYSLFTLSSATIFLLIGCGSSSSSSNPFAVLVSDAYVVNAKVTSGSISAHEDTNRSAGWYQFKTSISETIIVSGGVNDINPPDGNATQGEPYAPTLRAPSHYQNINPFTTMMLLNKEAAQKNYPNAYQYDSSFNFDVVKVSEHNFSIAQENTKAALELSAIQSTKKTENLRIINGEQVEENDPTWKFIVSLQASNGHNCGASLIHPEWVLTAAHCTVGYPKLTSALADTYSLVIGGISREVEASYPHPQYDPVTVDNDIGLMHLKTPITDITPILLDRAGPEDESMIKVAGWGNTLIDGSNYPNDLMQVDMPIINFETCNASYQSLTNNMFCAGYMDGSKDSCSGDSGGPLIHNNKLSGIVSFGGSDEQWCGAPNYPGVYTRVANYIEWIESYTGPLAGILPKEIYLEIDEAQTLDELDAITIEYMGDYNGVYGQ